MRSITWKMTRTKAELFNQAMGAACATIAAMYIDSKIPPEEQERQKLDRARRAADILADAFKMENPLDALHNPDDH